MGAASGKRVATSDPVYRIYFAKPGATLLLLLLGGDKTSQAADIGKAQKFWADCVEAKNRGKAE